MAGRWVLVGTYDSPVEARRAMNALQSDSGERGQYKVKRVAGRYELWRVSGARP